MINFIFPKESEEIVSNKEKTIFKHFCHGVGKFYCITCQEFINDESLSSIIFESQLKLSKGVGIHLHDETKTHQICWICDEHGVEAC